MRLLLGDIAIALALVGAAEVAFRVARAARGRLPEALKSQISTVEAASLGLLALMLGFTLSMVESRFNARRVIVMSEAAAVITAYHRAELLPEPERTRSRTLLRNYASARRAYFQASEAESPATTMRARVIHAEVWANALSAAQAHPDWAVLSTYIESVGQVLQQEEARDLAIQARLPRTIYMLLILIALVATSITGYSLGLVGIRSPLTLYVLPILIALAWTVIADLDTSRAGFLTTGDLPMQRVEQMMAVDRAAVR